MMIIIYNNRGGERDSNLELYRIITMLLIVAHHFVVNSGVLNEAYEMPLSKNSIFLFLFGAWGKTGINCFMMITGYFMCKSNITLKKYLKLICEILFYNIVLASIFFAFGHGTIIDILNAFLLIRIIDSNHFFACFLVFYMMIPFLNILLRNLSKRQHGRLIGLLTFVYIFLSTMPKFNITTNYVSWFSVLYIIAAYIRFYPPLKRAWGRLTILFVATAVVSILVCLEAGVKLNKHAAYRFVTDSNTFLAFAISFCSFMLFLNLKIRKSKLINTIARSTFGVLCIHANSMTMINWLWKDCLNVSAAYKFPFMKLVIFSLLSVFGVFSVCVLVDFIRVNTVEKVFLSKLEHNRWFLRAKHKFEIT